MKQTTQNYKGFHNWSLAFQTNKEATEGLASNSCSHQSPTGRQKWRRGDGRLWRMKITQIPALQANRHKTPLPDNQRVHTMLTWLAQRGTSSQGQLRQPSLKKKIKDIKLKQQDIILMWNAKSTEIGHQTWYRTSSDVTQSLHQCILNNWYFKFGSHLAASK